MDMWNFCGQRVDYRILLGRNSRKGATAAVLSLTRAGNSPKPSLHLQTASRWEEWARVATSPFLPLFFLSNSQSAFACCIILPLLPVQKIGGRGRAGRDKSAPHTQILLYWFSCLCWVIVLRPGSCSLCTMKCVHTDYASEILRLMPWTTGDAYAIITWRGVVSQIWYTNWVRELCFDGMASSSFFFCLLLGAISTIQKHL